MRYALILAAFAFASHTAAAAQILSEEPHTGMLGPGQVVYVDNGKCKNGMVLQVTGGNNANRGGGAFAKRQYKCVPRPTN